MTTAREGLLITVSHPDDETFGTGSLIAHASARGVPVTVCCATRGEADELENGVETADVAALREAELLSAARHLGATDVRLLGFADSGMSGTPPERSLQRVPLTTVAAAVAEVIDEVRPGVLVTLDASDGHRDHVRIREATLAALDVCSWQPGRVYLSCLPRRLMARWVEALREETPASEHLALAALAELGTPEDEITTVVDTGSHYDRRWEAIRLHRTQRSPYEVMGPDLQRAFLATDRLRRIRPSWEGGPLETDFLTAAP